MPAGSVAETEFKVVEISVVTDAELERVLNDTARKGWSLDGIQFAMSDASRRRELVSTGTLSL